MKRQKRERICLRLAAISALLCVAIIALWVRSCFVADLFDHTFVDQSKPSEVSFFVLQGRLDHGGFGVLGYRQLVVRGSAATTQPSDISDLWDRIQQDAIRRQRETHRLWIRTPIAAADGSTPWWMLYGVTVRTISHGGGAPPGNRYQTSLTNVRVPLWLPLAIAFLAALIFWTLRGRVSHPPGHCQTCGYDLRGTPEQCPECGEVSLVK